MKEKSSHKDIIEEYLKRKTLQEAFKDINSTPFTWYKKVLGNLQEVNNEK